eukprot:254836-Amphidinium_carterae.1
MLQRRDCLQGVPIGAHIPCQRQSAIADEAHIFNHSSSEYNFQQGNPTMYLAGAYLDGSVPPCQTAKTPSRHCP